MKYYSYYVGEIASCIGATVSGLICFDGFIHKNYEQVGYGILTGIVFYGLNKAFSSERNRLTGLEKKIDS
ncbi:MAG: hypothetical protein Q8Q01_02720 [archaeon]|nr:hypothetical protein [archaeon]